ncbi:MAG: TSUP family transporter [Hyphomicrobiales bacterium]|nr:TSUP family transporter [Hyphomicrobiales bacterium]
MIDAAVVAGLGAVAFAAGFVDSIAGGGGLLTVPALLIAGLDPVTALATNKIQGLAGSTSATFAFARRGLIDWRTAWPAALGSGLASIAGAYCVKLTPRAVLEAAVPVMLIAIALYFAFGPRITDGDSRARISQKAFAFTAAPAIGFYDGVFGPGTGTFFMLAFITLAGLGVVRATAHTKLCNAASNLGSATFFIFSGAIVWTIGLAMAAGQFLGAQLGARLAMKLGVRIIRPLLIVVCCAMAAKLLADPANPLRHALGF